MEWACTKNPTPVFLLCGLHKNNAKWPGFLFSFLVVYLSLSPKCYLLIVEILEISDTQKGENGITQNLKHCGNVVNAFPSRLFVFFFSYLKTRDRATELTGALRMPTASQSGEWEEPTLMSGDT